MFYKIKSYIYLVLLICPMGIALNSDSYLKSPFRWVPLDSGLRYDQACFLTAHNAFASVEDGWHRYMMQTINIPNQLEHGVRGLMLDVHLHENQLKLCHGGCKFIHSFQQSVTAGFSSLIWPNQEYKLFTQQLELIIDWLERHPLEIVTVFLESHVDKNLLNKALQSVNGLESLTLQPHEWDFQENDGVWPTIGWMRKHNKRLLFFHEDKYSPQLGAGPYGINQDTPTVYTSSNTYHKDTQEPFIFWEVWHHVIESQYGTLDKTKVCVERDHSQVHAEKERQLYLLNYFGTFAGSPAKSRINNAYETLKEIIKLCQTEKLAQGRTPNFIALDFIDEGEGLELANFYNREAKSNLGTIQVYKPIDGYDDYLELIKNNN